MKERRKMGGTDMMVKNTCRNRLTALINTARRYSHASPDIMANCERWVVSS